MIQDIISAYSFNCDLKEIAKIRSAQKLLDIYGNIFFHNMSILLRIFFISSSFVLLSFTRICLVTTFSKFNSILRLRKKVYFLGRKKHSKQNATIVLPC